MVLSDGVILHAAQPCHNIHDMTLRLAALALSLFVGAQDETERHLRGLVEMLRSEKVEDREEAASKLKSLGRAALPGLDKASKDKDPEVAERAKRLARIILTLEKLTPNLVKRIPGVEERVSDGGPSAWADLLTQIAPSESERLGYAGLRKHDLEVLAHLALGRDGAHASKIAVLHSIERWKIGSTGAALSEILKADTEELWNPALLACETVKRAEIASPILQFFRKSQSLDHLTAARVLGGLRVTESIPEIVPLLASDDDETRWIGIQVLGDLDAVDQASKIRALLKHESPSTRIKAIDTLARLRVTLEPSEIVSWIRQAESTVDTISVPWLGARKASPEIKGLLRDRDPGVRARAVDVLGSSGAADCIPDMLALLEDPDEDVRGYAAWALADVNAKGAIPRIRALLREKPESSARKYVHALGELDAKEALPEITPFLQDKNEDTRSTAVVAVAKLGANESIPLLLPLLGDPDRSVRAYACIAFRMLDARTLAPKLVELLKDPDDYLRDWAAYALETLGSRDLVPDLLPLLKSQSFSKQAIRVLGSVRAREAIPPIRAALANGSLEVRDAALEALGRLDAREVWRDLAAFLDDPYPSSRCAAIEALDQMAEAEAGPDVQRLLSDGSPEVRRAAAAFLCHRGLRAGAEGILTESDNLMPLNALRQPETWKKLRSRLLTAHLRGNTKDSLERLAQEAGMPLSLPAAEPRVECWLSRQGYHNWPIAGMSILEAVDAVFLNTCVYRDSKADREFQVVLEPDRIRILPRREALQFWQAWWKEFDAKK